MPHIVNKINKFFKNDLWNLDTSTLTVFKYRLVKFLRLISFTLREIYENELTLRAMSLVYTTLLSIVPLIAFSFSVLKAFGVVDNQLEPLLLRFLTPLGDKGIEITDKIMGFVVNMNVGVLGTIGLLALVYTVFSLIKKIDDSINTIWNVKKGRSFVRRFSNYISLTLIGPVLMFIVIGLTASLTSNTIVQKLASVEPFGTLLIIWGRLLPYLVITIVFTFIYIIVPNTKANFKSSLLGGFIAGISWQAVGTLFAISVASSTRYTAIYSSFAVFILFMLWLYISWLILLLGAQIAYCHQNLDHFGSKFDITDMSTKFKEQVAFLIMFIIGRNFLNKEPHLTLDDIVKRTEMPYDSIVSTLKDLENSNLLVETADEPARYIPSRAITNIHLKDIILSVRLKQQSELLIKRNKNFNEVEQLMEKINNSINQTIENRSLADIVIPNND